MTLRMTVADFLHKYSEAFQMKGIHNARQELLWILKHALKSSYTEVALNQMRKMTAAETAEAEVAAERRFQGEPLQYILGVVEFHNIELEVGPGVLIPRPETELLVELATKLYSGHGAICDLCTGTGAIALALAQALEECDLIVGTDVSASALEYAETNRKRLGFEKKVEFFHGSLFEPLPKDLKFTLITANPPYIAPSAYEELPSEVKDYEPKTALYAEQGGLAVLGAIISGSTAYLEPDGWLICEISSEQGTVVADCCRSSGFKNVSVIKDYADLDRFVQAQKDLQA